MAATNPKKKIGSAVSELKMTVYQNGKWECFFSLEYRNSVRPFTRNEKIELFAGLLKNGGSKSKPVNISAVSLAYIAENKGITANKWNCLRYYEKGTWHYPLEHKIPDIQAENLPNLVLWMLQDDGKTVTVFPRNNMEIDVPEIYTSCATAYRMAQDAAETAYRHNSSVAQIKLAYLYCNKQKIGRIDVHRTLVCEIGSSSLILPATLSKI